jgi:hypothetical protein
MPKTLFATTPALNIATIAKTFVNTINSIRMFTDNVKILYDRNGYVMKSGIEASITLRDVSLSFS